MSFLYNPTRVSDLIVSNSINLAQDLTQFKINGHHKFIIYDTKNLLVNVPIQEILNITDNFLQWRAIDPISKNQILQMMKTVLSQNYFTFSVNLYQPPKGIGMGSSI